MGAGLVRDPKKALIYPNPYHADRHPCIYFDNLSQDSTIQIFTISGELVREIKTDSSRMEWDTCNSAGEKAASGSYICLIKDLAGNKKVGKFCIIR